MQRKGVYVLLIEAHGETEVGRLGRQRFDGLYLYVGSAMGPGGFKRVERHVAVACGSKRTRRWHIDSLLELGQLKGAFVMETLDREMECVLACKLAGWAEPTVDGFGSSDCACRTHLFRVASPQGLRKSLRSLGMQRVL